MDYYRMNFDLMYNYKFSLSEIESMLPFERDIYIMLLVEHLNKKKEK